MLLRLRVVGGVEVRDGCFGERVRNDGPSCYGLGLGTLRRRSRVKGKCCGRQSCANSFAAHSTSPSPVTSGVGSPVLTRNNSGRRSSPSHQSTRPGPPPPPPPSAAATSITST